MALSLSGPLSVSNGIISPLLRSTGMTGFLMLNHPCILGGDSTCDVHVLNTLLNCLANVFLGIFELEGANELFHL